MAMRKKNNNGQSVKATLSKMNAVLNEVQQARGRIPKKAKRKVTAQAGSVNRLEAAPASLGRVRVNPPKAVQGMNAAGSRTVKFEEYVQDITASATASQFKAQRFPVQPGLSTLFAWLADQAINYQEYRFKRISFRFESAQGSGVAGKIMFAFSPDAADPIPVNKQEMLEYGIKGKSDVWQEFEMPVPTNEALGSKRYIRSGTLAANLDIKTYDIGALFVASSGVVTASLPLGELYVKYELELITPVVQSLAAAQARSLTITAATGVAESTPFGTAPVLLGGLDVTPTATGNALIFNRVGNYLVAMETVGTGLNTVYAPTGTVGDEFNLTLASFGSISQIPGISNAAANAGTEARVSFAVVVAQRGAYFYPTLSPQGATTTNTVTRITTYSLV